MNVLFATGSPATYMLPPVLSDRQVVCGPDWSDRKELDGRVLSLATPVGSYDLAAIAAKLPREQQPDVVVCLVDASWRNLPANLGAFNCPKVVLIADTHHMKSPLLGTIRYLASEPYDRCVVLYDRHHAAFFQSAGFRNLFWLPGLTFPHSDAVVRAARRESVRQPQIAFVGQAGKHHPRRARLLTALSERNLPVVAKGMRQAEALRFYGGSLLGFNASLNGDLNLRVLEIMAAGGALLTDRLAAGAGLGQLFADGRELLLYGSPEELAERAAHALAHPRTARAIGAAGAQWFDQHYGETRRRELFRSVAFDGVAAPEFEFSAAEKTRVFFGGDTDHLLNSLSVYEGIQEIHRSEETVRVQIGDDEPADLQEIFATLPRVEWARAADETAADLTVFARARLDEGVAFNSPMLWCWNAQPTDFELLARGLAPAGYALASESVALLCQQTTPEHTAVAPAAHATAATVMQLSIGVPVGEQTERFASLLNSLVASCARYVGLVEIIVGDDSGGEHIHETVARYSDALPIRYVRNAKSLGLNATAHNLAARHASGLFTWVIGAGDLVRGDAVGRILNVIARHPELDFIYTNSSVQPGEQFTARIREGLVLSEAFAVAGPTLTEATLDQPGRRFDDLVEPVFEEALRGVGGGAVFRTALWCAHLDSSADETAAHALAKLCPFLPGLARTLVGRKAYSMAYPARIAFSEVRAVSVSSPGSFLLTWPKLLTYLEEQGLASKRVDRCREIFTREAIGALRIMALDATTPGFCEFDLTLFLQENRVAAPLIFECLDDLVSEAGRRGIQNRLVAEAEQLVGRYPSNKMPPAAPVVVQRLKNTEAFQAAVAKAENFLRAGEIAAAGAELRQAKLCAPNAECLAKAEQVLVMLNDLPTTETSVTAASSEDVFTEEESANILAIIAAHHDDPTNPELLSQLQALKSGLADFLKRTDPDRIPGLFEADFGQIYRQIVALPLHDDPTDPTSGDFDAAIKAGFQAPGYFDPHPLLSHLLSTPNASRN